MIVGFTGTREGMSHHQLVQLAMVLSWLSPFPEEDKSYEFHYGTHNDVELHADAVAAVVAKQHGFTPVPHNASNGEELARNQRIIDKVAILIAAPLIDKEQQRSGTWATIRYARKASKPVIMLSRGGKP